MTSPNESSDPLQKLIESVKVARQDAIAAHQKVVASPDYQAEWKHVRGATFHFIQAIQACFLMTRRAPELYDRLLMFRLTDDLLQSCIAALYLVENGMHNPVAREMRFMIESGVKQLYVDQKQLGQSFEARLTYLNDEVDRSSISMVEQLDLDGFDALVKKDFCNELTDMYYKQCAYVHPSKKQIEEQVARCEAGMPLGFESVAEIRRMGKLLFRLYDMLLVLHFQGLGMSLAGDVMIQCFDDDPKWKFHKGKYTRALSSHFDYKAERTNGKKSDRDTPKGDSSVE